MARPRKWLAPTVVGRPDGGHDIVWRDEEAGRIRRTSLGTKDPVEAQARFAAWVAERANLGSLVGNGGLTVRGVLDDYRREHVETRNVATSRQYDVLRILDRYFGDLPVSKLTVPASRQYADARRSGALGRVVCDATIRRELAILNAALRHAQRWGRIERAPVMELPPRGMPRERWLKHSELQALLDAASIRARIFIRIAYVYARRKQAVMQLTLDRIDWDAGLIDFREPNRPQTNKRTGIKPILPEIREELREWYAMAQSYGSPYIVLHGGTIRFAFAAAARRAGLGPDVTPHVLKHTRITHLLQAGVSPWQVAKLADTSLHTIERVYGHHCPDHLREIQAIKPT